MLDKHTNSTLIKYTLDVVYNLLSTGEKLKTFDSKLNLIAKELEDR